MYFVSYVLSVPSTVQKEAIAMRGKNQTSFQLAELHKTT